MQTANLSSSRFKTTLITMMMIAAFGVSLCAQEAPAVHAGYTRITGLPDDWTHHRVVFSNPGTEKAAIKNGTHEHWLKTVNDPRYVMHALKRGLPVQGPSADDVKMRYREASRYSDRWGRGDRRKHGDPTSSASNTSMHRDWSMSLGNGGNLNPGQYPAKYNFSTTAATCSDIVVFPTGLTGVSGGQATIVGYNNLYANTCYSGAQTGPSIAWAYYTRTGGTGTGGTASLSPVISSDGTQIAYIQTVGTAAALVLLKPSATSGGTVAASITPTFNSLANYRGCTAPCYTTITLNGSPNDTNSAPYYDYDSDAIYVGDNSGVLHKFTGVFEGTPAETTGGVAGVSGWPQTLSSGVLTSPVYDLTSGNVFVGSSSGYLFRIASSGGANTYSGYLAVGQAAGGRGIVDSPMIDATPTTPVVYVFVGDDGASTPHSAVYQMPANFGSGSSGTKEVASGTTGSTTLAVYDGDFDDTHYSGAGITGNLYFCGGTSGTPATPYLYKVALNAGFTGAVTSIKALASGTATCSPITEFMNDGSGSPITALSSKSLVNTTLTATLTNGGATATVGSIAGLATGDYLLIDNEFILVSNTPSGTSVPVTHAQLNTLSATHTSGATVNEMEISTFTTTTTASIATTTTTSVSVSSSTNIAVGDYIRIGTEYMYVSAVAGTTLTVTRGALGTTAATHTFVGSTVTIRHVTLSNTLLKVGSVTSIGVGSYIQVDSENLLVTSVTGTTLTVTRGVLGTMAASHASGANVTIPALDWAYLSVTAFGSDTGCTGSSTNGCVYNYNIGNSAGSITPTAATAGLPAAGGTSGIVIDNSNITPGESQIYYTTLSNQTCTGNGTTGNGTGGCAIQASQSGLN